MGWYATKHAVGVYGATPPAHGWRRGETTEAQQVIDSSALPVADEANSPGVVAAAAVVIGRDGAVSAAPVIARLPDGRQMAAAASPDELTALAGRDLVGSHIEVSGTPPRYRLTP
jgi:acetyl-CoA C-acetyltransferase